MNRLPVIGLEGGLAIALVHIRAPACLRRRDRERTRRIALPLPSAAQTSA